MHTQAVLRERAAISRIATVSGATHAPMGGSGEPTMMKVSSVRDGNGTVATRRSQALRTMPPSSEATVSW